jgi:peptidyl-prolyl cis-trans isomerase B (cyclophilin B)
MTFFFFLRCIPQKCTRKLYFAQAQFVLECRLYSIFNLKFPMKKVLLTTCYLLLTISLIGCGQQDNLDTSMDTSTLPTHATMQLQPATGDTVAKISTNHGDIMMLLYTKEAPETAKNFAELAKDKKFDGSIFHRVIDDFMIQGGDFENRNGTGGYSYKGAGTKLQDEFGEGLTHLRGAVSMANAGPNTGGSQFFIVNAPDGTAFLDGRHAIFGYVYEGMDVVDKIAQVEKDAGDRPTKDVVMESVTISIFN